MKLSGIKKIDSSHPQWKIFFGDNSNRDWVYAQKACPLRFTDGSYYFIYEPLLNYFFVKLKDEEKIQLERRLNVLEIK